MRVIILQLIARLRAAVGTGLGGALALNLVVVLLTLPFLLVPRAASVRAGGWGLLVLALALYGLVGVLPRAWRQVREGRRTVGPVVLALALTPLPLAYVLFRLCARIKGYELAP